MYCLMGYMGSGKSFMAKKIAEQLQWKILDLDAYIEAHEEKSISQLMTDSPEYFRKLESAYLRKVAGEDYDLVSLGGGTPCFENNLSIITENFTSIYLQWKPESLYKRLVEEKEQRPLIAALNDSDLLSFIHSSLAEREKWYKQADILFDGESQNFENLIESIQSHALRKR